MVSVDKLLREQITDSRINKRRNNGSWKNSGVSNGKLVAKGAIIDYYQDTMQIPNGNIAKWGSDRS